jgi:hypothetical protein
MNTKAVVIPPRVSGERWSARTRFLNAIPGSAEEARHHRELEMLCEADLERAGTLLECGSVAEAEGLARSVEHTAPPWPCTGPGEGAQGIRDRAVELQLQCLRASLGAP